MTRLGGALAAALVAALALPATALGHATLAEASPGTQSTLGVPPTEIRLRFSQAVVVSPGSIRVLASDGSLHSGAARGTPDERGAVVPVSGLARGSAYTVRWQVAGRDGHSPAGVFTFGVGVPAPPPTEAVGASGTTWKDHVARWLLFAALALVIGPLAVRLLILRGPVPGHLERRFHLLTTAAAFAVIQVGILVFVIRASNALQLPWDDLAFGDLQPFAEKTRFGIAFLVMTVGFGVVCTLLMLAWIFDHAATAPRWAALAISVGLLWGLSLSGHQATEPDASALAELADWLHLVAAAIWAGGVVTLAFVVWPGTAPDLRRRAFLGFSRLAVGVVGLMVLAGAYLALVRLPEIADLWETGYGHVLLIKLALVSLALAWGGFHHTFVRPLLERGERPRVRPSLRGEATVAVAVLLAAAALTNASPPKDEEPASSAAVRTSR
jgi:copper transport protein